ncbi:MAG TPA: outer membrane beta-barrel domain-containing protein [Haliangium sp.]|nr:outer membrane beta-barrel domain-containing protein [Haliangium sp.]
MVAVASLALVGMMPARAQAQPQGQPAPSPGPAPAATPAPGATTLAPAPSLPASLPASLPSEEPLPSCEDRTLVDELAGRAGVRGVQKRDFLKDAHFQLTARGGLFAADLLSSSYMYGGALGYWFTEDFGLEVSFDVTPVALDLDRPLEEFFGDQRFEPGTGYLALAGLLWSPMHAKLKMGGRIVHADIAVAAGAGRFFHESVQGITFDAGLILEMFTSKWVTLRFDVRNVMAVQEAVAETRLTNNIIATAGLALWFPSGL